MASLTGQTGGNAIPPIDREGLAVVRLIQRHTSLPESTLKSEAPSFLEDAHKFDASFAALRTNGWIIRGGAGWRLAETAETWLATISSTITTEDEELGPPDQPTKPYDVAKLKVEQRTLSVFQALRKIEREEIILNPDFQRAFVWDDVRQSRLIESILIRIPLPAFYLDATDQVKWNVVDGLQRLSTLYRYCRKHDLPLTGLEFLTELDGLRFPQLPRKYQVIIEDDTQLIFNNLLPGTPIEAKFTIFSRVNTGGMQLTAQEIRHALNQGPITLLLRRLASSREFLAATDGSVDPRRMTDQEIILRAISFLHFGWNSYQGFDELDKYLVNTMQDFNKEPSQTLRALGESFLACMSKVRQVFRNYAFRKFYERGGRRGPLNKALFEAWTVAVQNYSQDALAQNRDDIVDRFLHLMNEDTAFLNSITYGTGKFSTVKIRFDRIEGLLRDVFK